MPEYPDVTVYLEALALCVIGQPLEAVRVRGPALVRTADPPLREATGKRVTALRRQGKRLVFVLEDDLYLVLHLMTATARRSTLTGALPSALLLMLT